MSFSNPVPASKLAASLGIRALIYGPPGCGKTPALDHLREWNPYVLVTEPAYGSMRHSSIACYRATTSREILDWSQWCVGSSEAKQYGVKCIDSLSEACEISLKEKLAAGSKSGKEAHGLRAYGMMAEEIKTVIDKLWFQPGLHLICLAKEVVEGGYSRPYFPGKELQTFIPHRFDWISRVCAVQTPEGSVKMFRNNNAFDCEVRERTGALSDTEPFDLSECCKKLLGV